MRRLSVVILTVAVILALLGGFFGAALLFGDPSYRKFLDISVPVALGLAFALAIVGARLYRRSSAIQNGP